MASELQALLQLNTEKNSSLVVLQFLVATAEDKLLHVTGNYQYYVKLEGKHLNFCYNTRLEWNQWPGERKEGAFPYHEYSGFTERRTVFLEHVIVYTINYKRVVSILKALSGKRKENCL